MTTTNTDAKMTLDEAKVYLQDKTEFMKFDEALAIVKAAGETDFLASLGLAGDAQVKTERQNRAAAYLPTARISEDYEGLYKIGAALDSQEIMIEADATFQRYAEANHIEINKDDQVTMQIRRMNHDIKDYDLETLAQDPETKRLMDSSNVIDEENDFAPVSEADKKKLFEGLLEAAKNQTISDRAAEDDLFKMSEDKRRQEIRDSIKSTFQNKMLVAIGASNDMHLTEKTKKKSFSFVQYAKGVINYLTDTVSKGKKVDLHKGQLINSMVDTQLRMEERAKLYRQLGMVNAANAIDKQNTGFVNKMKGWFGKAYEMRHAVADNMKNNKYKYIALGLAGVTVAVSTPLVAAGTAAYIAAGYAGFIGAGSVVWPLVEKREAMLRQAKKDKNEALIATIKKQGLVASLKGAYNLMDAEEKKRYWQRAGVNTAAGVAGAAFIAAPALIGAKGALTSVALVSNKFVASTMRILGNLGVQAKFTIEDHLQAKKDQTEESRQKSKMSKISLLATTVAAVIAEGIGLAHSYLSGNEAPSSSGGKAQGLLDQHQGKGGKGGEILEQKPAPKAPTAEELAAQKAAEEAAAKAAEAAKVEVPSEYSKDMGITERQWNTMHKTGDFEEQYINAHNAQAANEGAFTNADGSEMTTERVVYMSNRVMALAKAHSDGHGGLIARMFDENHKEVFANKDGGWMYADGTAVTSKDIAPECWGTEQEVATFRALYKSINCGEKTNGVNSEIFRTLYERSQNQTGSNGNYMDQDECGKVHFLMGKKVTKIIHHDEPTPKQVKVKDEFKNEDTPRQVRVKEEFENNDVKREGVWEEERGTTMNGRNQHPNVIKSGNHVKSKTIEI